MIASNNLIGAVGYCVNYQNILSERRIEGKGEIRGDDVRNVGSNPKGVWQKRWITDGLSQSWL
jgi:hypothetical protein